MLKKSKPGTFCKAKKDVINCLKKSETFGAEYPGLNLILIQLTVSNRFSHASEGTQLLVPSSNGW